MLLLAHWLARLRETTSWLSGRRHQYRGCVLSVAGPTPAEVASSAPPSAEKAFDSGFPSYEAQRERYSLRQRGDGFLIDCKECKRPFVIKGLRCCTVQCERRHREREQIAATMAEMGMEPIAVVQRKCEHRGKAIPRYTGVGRARKETRKDARYCSKKRVQKAWRLSKCTQADLRPIDGSKSPSSGTCVEPSQIPRLLLAAA